MSKNFASKNGGEPRSFLEGVECVGKRSAQPTARSAEFCAREVAHGFGRRLEPDIARSGSRPSIIEFVSVKLSGPFKACNNAICHKCSDFVTRMGAGFHWT